MPFVKAQPNEFLVTGRRGHVVNRGSAVNVYLWPGTSWVLIPSTQQEATFEMTQESRDGIPLRFKGIVVYRVVRPEAAARMFDFSSPEAGHIEIKHLLGHVCLGELRAHVSQLTMEECVEQRKTTLTDVVATALRQTVSQGEGWGVELDVVQVAQVFIVDQELRRQLEAGVRNQIKSSSELSKLRMEEELREARAQSERKLLQETLETDRERCRTDQERLRLAEEAKLRQLESQTPLRLLEVQKEKELLEQQLEMLRLKIQVREIEAEHDLVLERRRQEMRKEILPLEQIPVVARSMSRMFQNSHLTFYGDSSSLLAALTPALSMLGQACAPALKMAANGSASRVST